MIDTFRLSGDPVTFIASNGEALVFLSLTERYLQKSSQAPTRTSRTGRHCVQQLRQVDPAPPPDYLHQVALVIPPTGKTRILSIDAQLVGAGGSRMRYLTESFAAGALRRGASIEQFLGPAATPAGVSVRRNPWQLPTRSTYTSEEDPDDFWDVTEFGSLEDREEDEFGRLIARADDPAHALATAEALVGASRTHWVNEGIIQDEYADYVHANRPAVEAPDGHPWPPESTPPSLTPTIQLPDLSNHLLE